MSHEPWFPGRDSDMSTGSVSPVTERSIRGMDSLSHLATMKALALAEPMER